MTFNRNLLPPSSPSPAERSSRNFTKRVIALSTEKVDPLYAVVSQIVFPDGKDKDPKSIDIDLEYILRQNITTGKLRYKYDQLMDLTVGADRDSNKDDKLVLIPSAFYEDDDDTNLTSSTSSENGNDDNTKNVPNLRTSTEVQAYLLKKIRARQDELENIYSFVTRHKQPTRDPDIYDICLKELYKLPVKVSMATGTDHPALTRLLRLSDHFQELTERELTKYLRTGNHGHRYSTEAEVSLQNSGSSPNSHITPSGMCALGNFLAVRLYMLDYVEEYVTKNEMPRPPTVEEIVAGVREGKCEPSWMSPKRFFSYIGLGWVWE